MPVGAFNKGAFSVTVELRKGLFPAQVVTVAVAPVSFEYTPSSLRGTWRPERAVPGPVTITYHILLSSLRLGPAAGNQLVRTQLGFATQRN